MKRNKVQLLVAKLFRLELKELPVSHNVKDRLFRFIFSKDKKALLQLYNALNNSNYQDPDELEILTLQNVIYLSMKNDLAFTIFLYLSVSSFIMGARRFRKSKSCVFQIPSHNHR